MICGLRLGPYVKAAADEDAAAGDGGGRGRVGQRDVLERVPPAGLEGELIAAKAEHVCDSAHLAPPVAGQCVAVEEEEAWPRSGRRRRAGGEADGAGGRGGEQGDEDERRREQCAERGHLKLRRANRRRYIPERLLSHSAEASALTAENRGMECPKASADALRKRKTPAVERKRSRRARPPHNATNSHMKARGLVVVSLCLPGLCAALRPPAPRVRMTAGMTAASAPAAVVPNPASLVTGLAFTGGWVDVFVWQTYGCYANMMTGNLLRCLECLTALRWVDGAFFTALIERSAAEG